MNKLQRLQAIIAGYGSILVAFSGGVDSSFLLKVASDCLPSDKILAVTVDSPIIPRHELATAQAVAEQLGVKHLLLETNPFEIPEFVANHPRRCYFCKKHLFSKLLELAKQSGLAVVADGTNADDQGDFRPGMEACRELGIKSPLLEAEITKSEIRQFSKEYSLPTWDLPSYACLATRFPYGTELTLAGVNRIEAGEAFLKKLGFGQLRLRDHGALARLEIEPGQFNLALEHREQLVTGLKDLGYEYICLDLQGYHSGSFNRMIEKEQKSQISG